MENGPTETSQGWESARVHFLMQVFFLRAVPGMQMIHRTCSRSAFYTPALYLAAELRFFVLSVTSSGFVSSSVLCCDRFPWFCFSQGSRRHHRHRHHLRLSRRDGRGLPADDGAGEEVPLPEPLHQPVLPATRNPRGQDGAGPGSCGELRPFPRRTFP